jgi:integral membrane protein (TIGR00529 family)
MSIVYLGVVFAVIVALLAFGRPLWQAILGGLAAVALLWRIPADDALLMFWTVLKRPGSLNVLAALYLITFLQRMLERRAMIRNASRDLNGLFHNRRINAAVAPMFIGLLPSAGAMIICGDIVKEATDGWLTPVEQAAATSWFRHIPESTLPTYSSVLLMLSISGVPLARFVPCMIVPVVALALIGYFSFLRRIPTDPGTPKSENRLRDAGNLAFHLWPLLLILALLLGFRAPIVPALLGVIVLFALMARFSPKELAPFFVSAFEKKLQLNTYLVLVLREYIAATGLLGELPAMLSALPLPPALVFALMFFVGGTISGSAGIIALGAPLAFSAMGASAPLMALLMCACHSASLVAPVHICLVVASEYFKVPLGRLIFRTLPLSLIFCALMVGYYALLTYVI